MMNKKVLLVDPTSITHMPPKILNQSESERSRKYGMAINRAVSEYLGDDVENINAFSGKFAVNYGLLMLSYLLKQNGVTTELISGDYFKKEEDFFEQLRKISKDYSVACLTSTTPQFAQVKKINDILKEGNPDIKTILGGPHTLYYKTGEKEENINVVHIGYGADESCRVILDWLKGVPVQDGIIKTDYYFDCPKDFDVIPKDQIDNTMLYSYVSFGCPNNCNYCVEHKLVKRVCYNSIDDKLNEIEILVNKYGRKFIHLADSDFLINRNMLEEFLNKLERKNLHCCFSINATPNTLSNPRNYELIKRFVGDGLVEILIGVEHFSDKVLKTLNKNYDLDKLFAALEKIKGDAKLPVMSLYTLVGLPNEDHDAIRENLEVFKKMNERHLYDFSFPKFFVPYPDTEIYLHPEKFNVRILNKDWQEYHRWCLPRVIEIIGMKDEDYVREIEEISKISKEQEVSEYDKDR